MKELILFVLCFSFLAPTLAQAADEYGVGLSELQVIANDTKVKTYFAQHGITSISRITQGLAAACGPNSPVQYILRVQQSLNGRLKNCQLTLWTKALDEQCWGNAPRETSIETLDCPR